MEAALELRVRKVVQTLSGGDHVTIFDAEVEFVLSGIEIQLLSVHPHDASPDEVAMATEAIRQGAEQVLSPLGRGAIIRVTRIVIHPIDFKPRKFMQYTAEQLKRLLKSQ